MSTTLKRPAVKEKASTGLVTYDDAMCIKIFNMLATKSMSEVGIELGLSTKYKTSASMIAGISRAFNRVLDNPDRFEISRDNAEQVAAIVKSRNTLASKNAGNGITAKKIEHLQGSTFEELALSNRAKAWNLLQIKMNSLLGSRKKLEKVSVGELAKVAGITFDKGQLIEGKATDHVALMAKVDSEMTPEVAMETILKMREYNNSMQNESK